jgi:hypothetical protein
VNLCSFNCPGPYRFKQNISDLDKMKINDNSCRVCLRIKFKEDIRPINAKTSEGVTFLELIKYATGIQLTMNPDFPEKICKYCIKQLESAACIKTICMESNERLVDLFNNFENLVLRHRQQVKEEVVENPDICATDKLEVVMTEVDRNIEVDVEPIKEEEPEFYVNDDEIETTPAVQYEYRVIQETVQEIIQHPAPIRTARNKCNACGMIFPNEVSLTNHLRFDHILRRHQCAVCQEFFLTSFGLEVHMKSHQTKPKRREKKFACSVCQKKYTTQRALDKHFGEKCGPSIFHCLECFNGFQHRHEIAHHMRATTNTVIDLTK